MDIPDLEELEWLESTALDDQFEDDFELDAEPPSPPSPPKPPQRPTLSIPPKPSPFQAQPRASHTSKKRPGSDILNSISLDVNDNPYIDKIGKRSKNEEEEPRDENFVRSEFPDVGPMGIGDVGDTEKNKEGSADDEEWLRYSPPRATVEEMEVVLEATQERILSRFASEIDGDCVPVTGLDGERVYAKICSSVEMDEERRDKKSSFRQEHVGEAIILDVFMHLEHLFHSEQFL